MIAARGSNGLTSERPSVRTATWTSALSGTPVERPMRAR